MHFSTIAASLTFLSGLVLGLPSSGPQTLDKRTTTYYGQATYFYTGLGACGGWNTNSQTIIALDSALYQRYSACGKWLTITNTKTGAKASGWIVDECPTCGSGSLDLSPTLFKKLGKESQGVLPIRWTVNGGKLKRSADNSTTEADPEFPPEMELTEADLAL